MALLPSDLEAFGHIKDPAQRAAIEQKLQRYIARGIWAQQALARLHAQAPSQPSPPDAPPGAK